MKQNLVILITIPIAAFAVIAVLNNRVAVISPDKF